MPGLVGKLETDVEIKCNAKDFHDIVSGRPHHISNVSPDKVQACGVHEGEFGVVGSIMFWNYHHDGKDQVVKNVIEAIDDETNLTVMKAIEGDLLKQFKAFKLSVQTTPKEGGGCLAHYKVEYEKLNEDVPDPVSFLEFVSHVGADIDTHLTGQS